MTAAVLAGPARAEAVAAVAGMTICALGGMRERRAQGHRRAPGQDGADLPAAIDPDAGPRAHRVDAAAVRAGRYCGGDGLGTAGCGGDRPGPGPVRDVGGAPGRVPGADVAGVPGRDRGGVRAGDLPAGPLERGPGPAGGDGPADRYAAHRQRRGLRPDGFQRLAGPGAEIHDEPGGAAHHGRAAAGGQAGRRRARRAACPAAGRAGLRRRRHGGDRPRCRGPGRRR